ncbi:peptidylprolyl isomerase [Ichthyenterobacterium sp. W332]|uniref:Peptidylprolyl isomerase n=1 Tax=Microcosmobacter mediterraneus TaxID=3075607 RepID=A0ABU2YMQ4_9FLAO|nr:peptidylprolyl isomerase [Ichthyenterobacterium sp. W332]MDT0559445.1 peptidylprolyl isomerase [Ichthyenterobacterium sp. W332]
MKLKSLLFLCFLTYAFCVNAQIAEDDILFTVDNEAISAEEFVRVYSKNLDLVKDEKQKDVDEYLKLFVNYQLKLKEARRLELDKNPKYVREFGNYKRQLTKNYMAESKVTDALVKEAYDRISYDLKVTHILIKLDEAQRDTTAVYNQISKLRDRAVNEGFDKVRTEIHNGKTIFGEDLGYFSGFKMVYDFETVAYNTPVGEISKPFRTQFGYHILNVQEKRPSRGQVTVAHIMIALRQADSTLDPAVRIKEIDQKLKQGEAFETLAKQFSDDKSSANKGGKLTPFKSGQLSSIVFENKAFSLKDEGQLTEPFKTEYGWHIVKLLKKVPLEPFENMKSELQNRVSRDSRSKIINSALAKDLMQKFSITESVETLNYFKTMVTQDYFKKNWVPAETFEGDKELLSINDESYTAQNFAKHLKGVQRQYFGKAVEIDYLIDKEYKQFLETMILTYHKNNLEKTNKEFADILKEYRDGLLLFDLMEKQIWNKASKDSLGLQNYYNTNKNKYQWNDRAEIIMATSAKKQNIDLVRDAFIAGKTQDDINQEFNTKKELKVIFTKGVKEINDPTLPTNFEVKEGVSKVYNHNDAYHVINVLSIFPAKLKTLEEARGRVINDYQNEIEDNWLKDLRSRFKVEINDAVLTKVKQEIKLKY